MSELSVAILAGTGGMIGWALSDFFSAYSLKKQKITETQVSFYIYAITSFLLWSFVITSAQPRPVILFGDLLQLFVFAIANVAAYLLFFSGLKKGTLSTISTVFGTYSVGATVISILFFGEGTSLFRLISLGIVFLGITAISIQSIKNLTIVKGFPQALLAAILLALFFPFWDGFLANHEGGLFWVALVNTMMTALFLITMKKQEKRFNKKPNGIRFLLFAGLANFLAVASTTWGFETTTLTSVVTVVSSAVPLISTALGYLIFRDKLIFTQYLGIAAVLLGTLILFGT